MSTSVTVPPDMAALARPDLSPQDVLALRRHYFADNAISLREGGELFAIAGKIGDAGCREWHQFFSEAITELLVHQVNPPGYLSDENARWFMDRILEDGHGASQDRIRDAPVASWRRARRVPGLPRRLRPESSVADVVLSG